MVQFIIGNSCHSAAMLAIDQTPLSKSRGFTLNGHLDIKTVSIESPVKSNLKVLKQLFDFAPE